jgi:hypothetical protein
VRGAARTTALLCTLLAGCGLGEEDVGPNPEDKKAATLECLDERGVEARSGRGNDIQVGDPPRGPLVRFYLTSGEAEAAQFQGKVEGTEHISSALVFVNDGSEDVLNDIEECLADLQ